MGSALSSSTYRSRASKEFCLVAAFADGRPFSTRGVIVAFRDLLASISLSYHNATLYNVLQTSYMLVVLHTLRKRILH